MCCSCSINHMRPRENSTNSDKFSLFSVFIWMFFSTWFSRAAHDIWKWQKKIVEIALTLTLTWEPYVWVCAVRVWIFRFLFFLALLNEFVWNFFFSFSQISSRGKETRVNWMSREKNENIFVCQKRAAKWIRENGFWAKYCFLRSACGRIGAKTHLSSPLPRFLSLSYDSNRLCTIHSSPHPNSDIFHNILRIYIRFTEPNSVETLNNTKMSHPRDAQRMESIHWLNSHFGVFRGKYEMKFIAIIFD